MCPKCNLKKIDLISIMPQALKITRYEVNMQCNTSRCPNTAPDVGKCWPRLSYRPHTSHCLLYPATELPPACGSLVASLLGGGSRAQCSTAGTTWKCLHWRVSPGGGEGAECWPATWPLLRGQAAASQGDPFVPPGAGASFQCTTRGRGPASTLNCHRLHFVPFTSNSIIQQKESFT